MKITVTWDGLDQNLLRFCFSADWTWDDYYNSLMQGMAMMASVVHTVDLLFCMGPGTDMPESAFQVGKPSNHCPAMRAVSCSAAATTIST
jgi:hypothetical protein